MLDCKGGRAGLGGAMLLGFLLSEGAALNSKNLAAASNKLVSVMVTRHLILLPSAKYMVSWDTCSQCSHLTHHSQPHPT
jgi:hypothetical protein